MNRSSHRSGKRHTKIFTAAKSAYRHFDNAGSRLARWITTDHSGFTRSMINMPTMGIWDTCRYILTNFVISLIGALLSGLMVFLLIAYGIPYFLFGSLP